MTTAPYAGPIPKPTPESQPFWDGLQAQKLMIQRCRACGDAYFYPRPSCPQCWSHDVEWFQASGRGTLHTYVISHRPGRSAPLPPPYVVAIVQLEEGPRLMTNLVDVEPDPTKIACDTPVEIVFAPISESITLPRFRPVAT